MNILYTRKTRQTGTTTALVDNRDGSFDDGDLPWFTLCQDHGGVCSHPTKALAEQWLSYPADWCPDCQERAGIDHDTPAGS